MTTNPIPPEETTEGNVTEIDLENRHILIEDRTGTPFMKLFWHKAQEEFDGKPTALFNQIRKLQKGFYVAPVITDVDASVSGKIKEAYIKGLPYKERGDFPRQQQKKGGFGGKPYTPRNEKPIIYQVCYKEACETARAIFNKGIFKVNGSAEIDLQETFDKLMDMALERAKKDAKVLIQESGCQ
ncbi:MAG: hypothetical protein M0Q91_18755 [Methanoregula sp.]|jgi:hypothetical protein|nr:hypothetical protein [Methanoregula sp.]